MGGRHHEHLGFHRTRVDAGRVPEFGAGGGQRIHHDQPLEVAQRLHHAVGIGADAGGGHPAQDQALHLSLERLVVDRHPGCVLRRLGNEIEGELVRLGGCIAIPALEQADHEVLVVDAEKVPGAGVAALGGAGLDIVIEVLLSRCRNAQIARQDLPGDGMVGIALDVGVAALGIHPAARAPDVPQQELQHRAGADQLPAGCMLRQADRIDDRHHLLRFAHLADQLGDPHELVLRYPGDT